MFHSNKRVQHKIPLTTPTQKNKKHDYIARTIPGIYDMFSIGYGLCVCVCVCVRERQREKERARTGLGTWLSYLMRDWTAAV